MNVEVNIDAGDVNKAVAAAVMESAIGTEIKKQIHEKLTDWRFGNAIRAAVDKAIEDGITRALMQPEYKEKIAEAVGKAMAEHQVDELVKAALDALWRKVKD